MCIGPATQVIELTILALLAGEAPLAYSLVAARFGLRSPDSTLALTVAGFVLDATALGLLTSLPVLAPMSR